MGNPVKGDGKPNPRQRASERMPAGFQTASNQASAPIKHIIMLMSSYAHWGDGGMPRDGASTQKMEGQVRQRRHGAPPRRQALDPRRSACRCSVGSITSRSTVSTCLQAPAMPPEAEVSVAAQPSGPSAGPWQQTAHGKGRVRPRKNAPPGTSVPRLAAVAHRCAVVAAVAAVASHVAATVYPQQPGNCTRCCVICKSA